MVLLPYFLWSKCSGSNERNNRQNFQNIFVFDSQWFCPQCYSRYSTLAYSNRKLIRRKMGFLKCKIFYEAIICTKVFIISKKKEYCSSKTVFHLHMQTSNPLEICFWRPPKKLSSLHREYIYIFIKLSIHNKLL